MRCSPVAVLVGAALAVSACAPQESTSAADPTGGPCSPEQLQTLEPGTLTAFDIRDDAAQALQKGSPISSCVSQAVDVLRADGTLADLEKKFLSDAAHAPVLR